MPATHTRRCSVSRQKRSVECLLTGSFSPDGLNDFITINDRDRGSPRCVARCSGTAGLPILCFSHTQPHLLIPPSVQSNDCPLHAPYHSILSIFLSHRGLLKILKYGVVMQFWFLHCGHGGCVARRQHCYPASMYKYLYQVLGSYLFLSFSLGYWVSQQINDGPRSRVTTEVRGQIKKVSWHWAWLPSDFFPPNGIKSLLTALS